MTLADRSGPLALRSASVVGRLGIAIDAPSPLGADEKRDATFIGGRTLLNHRSHVIASLAVIAAASLACPGCSPEGGGGTPPPAAPTPTGSTAAALTPAASTAPTAPGPAPAITALAAPPAPPANPCALPTTIAATPEETAWQIFVAVNCPTGNPRGAPLTWETWTEQTCFVKPSAPGCGPGIAAVATPVRHLHGSHLARKKLTLDATSEPGSCSPMTTASPTEPLSPFVPKNLARKPQFCEEVFVNAPEAVYSREPATGQSLATLAKQQAFATTATIQFPSQSVEVKADWLPAASITAPSFDCKSPPSGLHVEVIDGTCYALVGMHVSSKLLPDWLWATFEPQTTMTNPNRCNPKVYSDCNDPWGSSPAKSTGASTEQTPALAGLMKSANLAPEFANYRMVAAQTNFSDPTLFGNSFVEFNADVPPLQASCITCHSYAVLSAKTPPGAKSPENPNFGAFPGTPPVGAPTLPPPPAGGGAWVHQDFSWLLGVLPPK